MNIGSSIWASALSPGGSGGGNGGNGAAQEAVWLAYGHDGGTEEVYRINISAGTNTKLAATGGSLLRGVSVDDVNGKIYVCQLLDDEILRMNLDGSSVETFVSGVTQPSDVHVDETNGKVYAVSGNATGWIASFTVGGATRDGIIDDYGTDLRAVSQLGDGQDLVVAIGTGGQAKKELHRVTLAAVTTKIVTVDSAQNGLAVNIGASTFIYYGTDGNGIKRVKHDGTGATTIVDENNSFGKIDPNWLDVDDSWIYVGDMSTDKISIFDIETGAESKQITAPTGSSMQGIAVSFTTSTA